MGTLLFSTVAHNAVLKKEILRGALTTPSPDSFYNLRTVLAQNDDTWTKKMNTPNYDLRKLKPDGSHYLIIDFDLPYCLHLPDDDYQIAAEIQGRQVIIQIQLKIQRRKVRQDIGLLVPDDRAEKFADPQGTYRYSSARIYLPIRGSDPEIHSNQKELWRWIEMHHNDEILSWVISAVNRLVDTYRFCTGECHIRPLTGRDLWFDYNIGFLYNEYPPTARQPKFSGFTMPVYDFHDIVSEIPIVPGEVIKDLQSRLASGFQIPLWEELLLNAHDLLYQGNYRLAIIEAETGFESAFFGFLRDYLHNRPDDIREIEEINSFTARVNHNLSKEALNSKAKQFCRNESRYEKWKKNVWEVRGGLVHGRTANISVELAANGIRIIEETLEYLIERSQTNPWRYTTHSKI